LVAEELYAGAPMNSPTPVMPEKRRIPDSKWMQEYADLARLCSGAAIPLAPLTQRTGTTTANAGSIHHAQASIGFSALLMRDQFLISGAP
jgi:hypothetical protein